MRAVGFDDVDVHPDLTAAGPIARTAGDLALVLDVIAGADPLGPLGWRLTLPAPAAARPESLRVAVWPTHDAFPVSDAVEVIEARRRRARGCRRRSGSAGASGADLGRRGADRLRVVSRG